MTRAPLWRLPFETLSSSLCLFLPKSFRSAQIDHHTRATQIRAANLSGDCTLAQEFLRGNATADTLVGKHKRCVRRRALFSVALNPHCQGAKAEQAVAEMMPKCLRDTDPWPRVPGL